MLDKKIAYVLKVYPRFSQTFVINEILAHEAAGLKMDIFSMRLSDDVRFHEALSRVRSRVPSPVARRQACSIRFIGRRIFFPPCGKS